MTELFMSASKVLRDDLVIQLQKENNFLKKIYNNKNSKFFGKKVRINGYSTLDSSGNTIPIKEKEGIFIKFNNDRYDPHCLILLEIKNGNQFFVNVSIENFIFLDKIEF